MPKKGLKQVGDIHCDAHLHSYFTLMCNLTTIRMIPLQQNYRSEYDMLLSYTSKWSRAVDMYCGGCYHYKVFQSFLRQPYLSVLFLNSLLLFMHSLIWCISCHCMIWSFTDVKFSNLIPLAASVFTVWYTVYLVKPIVCKCLAFLHQ